MLYRGTTYSQQFSSTKFLSYLIIVVALGFSHQAQAQPRLESLQPSAYDPAQFTISYWCGPPANELTLERFLEIKEANFTVAFPPCGGMTTAQNRRMLDLCQQVGLKAIIGDRRMVQSIRGANDRQALDAIVQDYADHPALLGYHVKDEPHASEFNGLADVFRYLKQRDPIHPAYVNLNPTYGMEQNRIGTRTYEEYVRSFAHKTRPFVISYDHYLFTDTGDRPDFFENLATVRKISIETNTPFWNIVLVTESLQYRNPTEAELRFQAMQTLAFGARGLVWFTYWMPTGVPSPETWDHSIINRLGRRDPHYKMVKQINAETLAIGNALSNTQSRFIFHHGPGKTLNNQENSPIFPNGGTLTVGVFKDSQDRNLALVTNRDYRRPSRTEIYLKSTERPVEVFDTTKNDWVAAYSISPYVVPMNLPPAGALLIRW